MREGYPQKQDSVHEMSYSGLELESVLDRAGDIGEDNEESLERVERLLEQTKRLDLMVAKEVAGYVAGCEGIEYVCDGQELPRDDIKDVPQSPSD